MLLILFVLLSNSDAAIGVSDKGELSNVTSNYGLIANLHYFTPAFHWPNAAPFQHQYCPGFGMLAARSDTVIESFLNLAAPEWAPLEGSYGTLYSGDVTAPDGTPYIATSDNEETWPTVAGERFWPGPYRKDTLGQEVEGEFTSDQDLFCIFNDQDVFGIQVDQSTYSWGRIYARDFLAYDYHIYSTRQEAVDNVYLGFRGNFRCDYDMQDYIGLYRDEDVTFVYYWDADGIPQEPWLSVGMIGVAFLHQEIDNFHYYEKQHEPGEDFRLYPIIVSDPTNPNIDSSLYFHGDNLYIDDPSLVQALPPESTSSYNFIVSSGPKTIMPNDTLQFTAVVICGEDSAALFKNLNTVLTMAENYFLGSGPPASPLVHTVPGHKRITLYWGAEPSESSVDMTTGKIDFEGYKVYRSEDQGKTWGKEITNEYGQIVGYVPLAQFDLKDGIAGTDPAFQYQSLGSESGLKHTFIDSTVYNGIEYWYCVTAYDKGNQNPDSLEPSYESAKGRPGAPNVDSVTAAPPPSGYIPASILGGDILHPIGGPCEALALVTILNPSELTSHTYEVSFADTTYEDSTWTTFTLFDMTAQETTLYNHELSDSSLDNVPVTDGFRLTLLNSESGVKSIDWTKVSGDTCTFEWWTGYLGFMAGNTYISGAADFRIVVDHANPATVQINDGFGGVHPSIQIPIRIYDITDSMNIIDVSDFTWLLDYAYSDTTDTIHYGPPGWDLIPGGAGYNPHPDWVLVGFVDQIGCENESGEAVYFATQNGPVTATPPSDGDEFTIMTYKPFSPAITYQFTIVPSSIDSDSIELSSVRVVPNPYILHSRFESTPYDRRIMFTNLPQRCEIQIYNIAGEHINTITHTNNLGYEYWDLRTKYGLEVAYGIYIYVVKTDNGAKAKGKFVIVK
ncbi:MAG: T9SS type A sorting domain-containing protein [candidate division WOR-3 bacterium]|nr:MAG: T9SS type A sorting domain-containing protein [candidate division WOR-3 bacterium]